MFLIQGNYFISDEKNINIFTADFEKTDFRV